MNKTELVNAIAEQANISKLQAKAALDATVAAISNALAEIGRASCRERV